MTQMTIATKLHLLLLFTIVAVALYMYFLYKELKSFQDDVANLKKQVQTLLHGQPVAQPLQPAVMVPVPVPSPASVVVSTQVPSKPAVVISQNVDEDDLSVTSNDIKDILTNIQDVDEDEPQPTTPTPVQAAPISEQNHEESLPSDDEVHETVSIMMEDDIVMTEKKPCPDFANMTESEISKMKYDDLRNFLRNQGINMKGTKQELVTKIKSIVYK